MSHIVDVCMIAGAEGTLTSFEPHSVIKWYQIAQKLPDSIFFKIILCVLGSNSKYVVICHIKIIHHSQHPIQQKQAFLH